jgi:hypothetical protein
MLSTVLALSASMSTSVAGHAMQWIHIVAAAFIVAAAPHL